MDTLLAIQTRRSVRKYTEQHIDEEKLDTILRAGMASPTAGNSQSWRFVVVDDKKLLASISSLSPYASMAASAALAIVVCADIKAEKYPGFWVQDCAAAMQNMLLAAHALGLGTCWAGLLTMAASRSKAIASALCIPESHKIYGALMLGRPKYGFKRLPERKRPPVRFL